MAATTFSRSNSTCSTYSDSAAASSETLDAASVVSPTMAATPPAAATASTSLSYQDEQQPQQHVMRAHLSSHHHYHLPHQFQHPHHQNHHTHGGVPVATPTVPASYAVTQHLLHHHHKTSPYTSSAMDEDSSGSVSGVSGPTPPAKPPHTHERRSPPGGATIGTSSVLLVADAASGASVSPGRLAGRLRDSSSHHRVTIDESNIATSSALSHQLDVRGGDGGDDGDGGSGGGGPGGSGPPSPGSSNRRLSSALGDDRQTGHLALMYHSHQLTSYPVLPAIKRTHRPSFIYPPMPRVRA